MWSIGKFGTYGFLCSLMATQMGAINVASAKPSVDSTPSGTSAKRSVRRDTAKKARAHRVVVPHRD